MSDSTPPPGPVAGLPIGKMILASYRAVLVEYPRHLPRAVFIPFCLSLAIIVGLFLSLGDDLRFYLDPMAGDARAEMTMMPRWLGPLVTLASLFPYVIFAVAWHRLILLGPEAAAPAWVPTWRRRHWRFFGTILVLILLFYLISFAIGMLALAVFAVVGAVGAAAEPMAGMSPLFMIPALVIAAVVFWAILRLSLVFPALAVEEHYGLGNAWRHTKGQGWRLLAIVVLGSIPILIANGVLTVLVAGLALLAASASQGGGAGSTLLLILSTYSVNVLLGYLTAAFGVTFLSLCFRRLTGWVPDSPSGG